MSHYNLDHPYLNRGYRSTSVDKVIEARSLYSTGIPESVCGRVIGVRSGSIKNILTAITWHGIELPPCQYPYIRPYNPPEKDGIVYKEVQDFPNYRITNTGELWSCHPNHRLGKPESTGWKKLKVNTHPTGYKITIICNEKGHHRRSIHELVLEAFVGIRPEGAICLHANDDKEDNRVENLRWGTTQENSDDMVRNNGQANGEKHGCSKLKEDQVREIRRRYKAGGITQKALAKEYGVARTTLTWILNNQHWTHLCDTTCDATPVDESPNSPCLLTPTTDS